MRELTAELPWNGAVKGEFVRGFRGCGEVQLDGVADANGGQVGYRLGQMQRRRDWWTRTGAASHAEQKEGCGESWIEKAS